MLRERLDATLKWLLEIIGLSYSGVVSSVVGATSFVSDDLKGHDDDFFNGWYVRCSWDAGGAGAVPQSEYQPVTDYVSASGTFTHTAFTVNLAATDKVQLMHPWLHEIMAIRGGTNTIQDLKDWQDENLDLARNSTYSGDIAFTAAGGEETAYEGTSSYPFKLSKALINFTGASFASGNIVVRVYKKIGSGEAYVCMWLLTVNAAWLAAYGVSQIEIGEAPDDNSVVLHFPLYGKYGIKITVDVADNQSIYCEFYDDKR